MTPSGPPAPPVPPAQTTRDRLLRLLLHLATAGTAAGLTTTAVMRYRECMSDWAFDLAFFHDLVANAAAGRGFVQSASTHEIDGLLHLSHAFFLLPLFVPFYALMPRLETLLVLQSLALASGVYPFARMARAAGAGRAVTLLAALLYLSSFPLWRLGLADFRELTFSIPALLWLIDGLTSRRLWPTALAAAAACLCREEVPLLVLGTATFLWLFRRTATGPALLAGGLAIAWFLLQFWLRPRAMGFYIPFDRPGTLLETLHTSMPEGISHLRPLEHLASYLAIGLWPALLEPVVLLGALPLLVYQLLFSSYEWWHWEGPYIHHTGPLLAFTAAAAALGWAWLDARARARGPRWSLLVTGFVVLALTIQLPLTARRVSQTMGWRDGDQALAQRAQQLRGINRLLEAIPGDARVATDYRLIARLSGRRWIYCYQANFKGLSDGRIPDDAPLPGLRDVDWMLIDETHDAWIARLDHDPEWRLYDTGEGYRLYARDHRG